VQPHEKILDFWFGNIDRTAAPDNDKQTLWFKKSDETDQEIREKFSADLDALKAGKYENWSNDPDRCLALIILTDQFTRNIFRNSPESFAYDPIALKNALLAIEKGYDQQYHLNKRFFFYMPLEHSEDIAIQKKNLQLFQEMVDTSPEDQKKQMAFFKDYADQHYKIIEEFGRFPHRNKTLGRVSTPEEIAFLEKPGSSF
jgi:uncharacterized protein (DUF924 family)